LDLTEICCVEEAKLPESEVTHTEVGVANLKSAPSYTAINNANFISSPYLFSPRAPGVLWLRTTLDWQLHCPVMPNSEVSSVQESGRYFMKMTKEKGVAL